MTEAMMGWALNGFLDVVERMGARLTLTTTKEPGIIRVKNDITGRIFQVDLDKIDAVPGKRLQEIFCGFGSTIAAEEAGAVRELAKAGK